jgi:hypothetical protein
VTLAAITIVAASSVVDVIIGVAESKIGGVRR